MSQQPIARIFRTLHAMTEDEFEKTALQMENDGEFVCDVRGFDGRQAEAVDFYLRVVSEKTESGGFSLTAQRSISVWCDHGTCFHYSTLDLYRELWRDAQIPIKIVEKRRQDGGRAWGPEAWARSTSASG